MGQGGLATTLRNCCKESSWIAFDLSFPQSLRQDREMLSYKSVYV